MDKAATPVFVGIDVAEHSLNIHSRPSGGRFTIGHDKEDVAALVGRLAALAPAPALIVLEATGGMEVRLAADLAAAGLDKTRAEVKLCPARDRLAALREQRSLSFLCRRACAEGYG